MRYYSTNGQAPLAGLGEAASVHAPEGTSAQGPLAANSLRLYVFPK